MRRVDPRAPIIEWNFEELFKFTHQLAAHRGAEILPEIDRIFLSNTQELVLFEAPHYTKLTPKLICVFLYGVAGQVAEPHLAKGLQQLPSQRDLIVEILLYVGSEQSAPQVAEIARTAKKPEIFKRAVTFLMLLGGSNGRRAVLGLRPENLDPDSREYYKSILPKVKAVSFETLAAEIDVLGPPAKVSADEARQLLDTMKKNNGVDNNTNPSTVVRSPLPKTELLREVIEIRSRMFRRRNNHALDDVATTNSIINALQFRSL